MPQKTNLNISPYYDDFDKEDKFYKVLFKQDSLFKQEINNSTIFLTESN